MRTNRGLPPWSTTRPPGSRTKSVCTCQGLRPRRVVGELAIARPFVWPSAYRTASAPGISTFSWLNSLPRRRPGAGLHTPLSTLHVRPHDRPRMTRGRCGSLLLHRNGLAPSALCRSPGAPDPGRSPGHYRALRSTPHRSFVAGATGGHAAGMQTIRSCETVDNDQRLKGARRLRPSLYCDGEEPPAPVQPVERKLAAIFAAATAVDG